MKLFDIANRFKPPLNFNHNNFYNISSKIQGKNKNVTTTRQDQFSKKLSWIQEELMVLVCQPTKVPGPLDLGRLTISNKEQPKTCVLNSDRNFQRGFVQENLMVLVCKPTWCPPNFDIKLSSSTKRDEMFDLLGLGSFGDVPAVPPSLFDEERNTGYLDRLNEATHLRSSILFDPDMFSPSCSPLQVDLCSTHSTLSIGISPRDRPISVSPQNILPIISTQVSSDVSNPEKSMNSFKSLSSPAFDTGLCVVAESLEGRPATPYLQPASSTGVSPLETRIPTTPSVVSFVPKSISVKTKSVPLLKTGISAALPRILPVSVPVIPTRLFAVQGSVHTLSSSVSTCQSVSLPALDTGLCVVAESLEGIPASPYLLPTSSTGVSPLETRTPLETRIPTTPSFVPFVPKSISVKIKSVPPLKTGISAALPSILPVSVPVIPTRLFAVQTSVHAPSTSVSTSPASLVAAAANLLSMAPALTFSSGSSLEEICFTGGQASSIEMLFSHTSETALIQMPPTPNFASPIMPQNQAYLMTVNMVSVMSERGHRLNVSIVETMESPVQRLQNNLAISVAMTAAPIPPNAESRGIEAELLALMDSDEEPSPSIHARLQNGLAVSVAMAASPNPPNAQSNGIEAELLAQMDSDEEPSAVHRIPMNLRRPLYMVAPPPQGQYMGVQPPQETTINPYDGDVHLFGENHYNYQVIGQQIETMDVKIDILSCLHFLFQTNPATGMVNVIGSGMFGSVFTATHLPTGQTVAIKSQYHALEDGHKIITEARIMQLLSDTGYVPKLYGLLPDPTDQRKLLIVMEMIGSGMTLRQKLQENTLDERQKICLALRLTVGLHTIHNKNVLLNDIKDDNIIVFSYLGSDIQAKYIDFGHASCGFVKKYRGNGITNAMCTHLAPEVREGNPTTRASDIFGLGYTIALFRVTKLVEVVDQCMCPDPGQRPCTAIVSQTIMDLL